MASKWWSQGLLSCFQALLFALVMVACGSGIGSLPGDDLVAFAPDSLMNLYFNHREAKLHVVMTRWNEGGPISTSCDRPDEVHQSLRSNPEAEALVKGLSNLKVRRLIGLATEMEISQYGFGPHESSGFLVLGFVTMDLETINLGFFDMDSDEIYAIHAGQIVTLEAAPFRALGKLCL